MSRRIGISALIWWTLQRNNNLQCQIQRKRYHTHYQKNTWYSTSHLLFIWKRKKDSAVLKEMNHAKPLKVDDGFFEREKKRFYSSTQVRGSPIPSFPTRSICSIQLVWNELWTQPQTNLVLDSNWVDLIHSVKTETKKSRTSTRKKRVVCIYSTLTWYLEANVGKQHQCWKKETQTACKDRIVAFVQTQVNISNNQETSMIKDLI